MNTSENIDKLAPALLAAQKAIKWAQKDATNPHFKNRYADLQGVIEAVKPALNDAGIAFLQTATKSDDGKLHLVTRLVHQSGQWVEDTAVCPLAKMDPQGFGSALTYLRRYSLGSIVGLFSSDDDAEAACERTPPAPPAKATHEQIKELCEMGERTHEYAGRIASALAHYKANSVADLTEADAAKIIAALKKPAPKPASK